MDFQITDFPGYTLVELITILAIVSILLTIAIPGFQWLSARTRISTSVNLFLSHLYQARSEAVNREQVVVLCPSTDGRLCVADYRQWADGYIVFVDGDRNMLRDADEQVLRYFQGEGNNISIHTSSAARQTLAYLPTGRAWNSNTSIRFCTQNHDESNRTLIIASTGRPRLSRTLPDGSMVLCARP